MYSRQQTAAPQVHASAFNVLHGELVQHVLAWQSDRAAAAAAAAAASAASASTPSRAAAAGAVAEHDGKKNAAPAATPTDGASVPPAAVAEAATAASAATHRTLEALGWAAGRRLTERLLTRAPYRDVYGRQDAVRFVKQHLWPAAFAKELPRAHGVKDSDAAFRLADDAFPLLRHVDVDACLARQQRQLRRGDGSAGGAGDAGGGAAGVGNRTAVALPLHSVELPAPAADDGPHHHGTAAAAAASADVEPPLPLQPWGGDYLLWTQGLIGGCLEQLGFPRWTGVEDPSGPRAAVVSCRLAPTNGKEGQWSVTFKGAPSYMDIAPAGVRTA